MTADTVKALPMVCEDVIQFTRLKREFYKGRRRCRPLWEEIDNHPGRMIVKTGMGDYGENMYRILIVDDEAVLCNLLRSFLESEGFIVHVANDVDEAEHCLNEKEFDLVLTDLNMPGRSGLDLIQHVRNNHQDTGVVIVSVIDDPEEARKCLELGVYGYIIKPFTRNLVLITVENALRLLHLERKERRLKHSSEEKNRLIMDHIGIGIALISTDGRVLEMNNTMQRWFPHAVAGTDKPCYQIFADSARPKPCHGCPTMIALESGRAAEAIVGDYERKGTKTYRITASPVTDKSGQIFAAIEMVEDVTEKMAMEQELRQAQKLEAIGQLAAGIAHEINTPIQYIADNMNFLGDAYTDVRAALETYADCLNTAEENRDVALIRENIERCKGTLQELDLEYLLEEIPRSISQSLDGLTKVSNIVRAMKQVSHPGSDSKLEINLNNLMENILVISRNEYKYVADLETDFAENLQTISCYPDKLNQVFLNLIINAGHAIGDSILAKKYDKGLIKITTLNLPNSVRVTIEDNGCGIPETIREKVYDLFFTTKEAGKGTGQGLAIARGIIVQEHGGSLEFTSDEGKGTTFIVDLPAEVRERGPNDIADE